MYIIIRFFLLIKKICGLRSFRNSEMSLSIRIFLPRLPVEETINFKGYVSFSDKQEIVIYITEYWTKHVPVAEQSLKKQAIYGHCTDLSKKKRKIDKIRSENYLILENTQNPRITHLLINGQIIDSIDNTIILLYDHNKIRNTETVSGDADNISKLQVLVQNSQSSANYEPILKCPYWLASSLFAQHVLNYFNFLNWLVYTIRRDRKVSIKQGNLILAIFMDVILGYLILRLLIQNKTDLSSMLMGVLEKLVNLLYSLLKWLMGAPAGLKLNNAFNNMLGKYFSYHIQLWWLFIGVSSEKLDVVLDAYYYLGYLGFTIQAAVISDMICVATFHSYCIYVYAARLFNIQVSGLIALLRLFVGRKYNPLRGGIDSCEYTNQELFVGTVAFTILLLLIPTTTIYYIVFTLLRLVSLVVQYILARLIYRVQTLPLYAAILWLVRSPKVAGNIFIEVVNTNSEERSPLLLRVKLLRTSLQELVANFTPPVETPKNFELTNVLSNVLVGKQIFYDTYVQSPAI